MAKTQSRAASALAAEQGTKHNKSEIPTREGEKAGFGVKRRPQNVPPEKDVQESAPASEAPESGQDAPVGEGASIPQADLSSDSATLGKVIGYKYLDANLIKEWEFKNRTDRSLEANPEETAEFIEEVRAAGFTSSIVVRPIEGSKPGDYQYEEIVGYKRCYAARYLGIPVPAEIRELTDVEAMRLQTAENSGRTNPPFWEDANAWARLDDRFGATQKEKAAAVGVDAGRFSTGLRIVRRMPDDIKNALNLVKFGYNTLVALMAFIEMDESPNKRQDRIDRIIENADEFEAKPEKGETLVNSIKRAYLASQPGAPKPVEPEVAKTPKGGKIYSIKQSKNGVTINLHQIGVEFADMDEIRKMLKDHLAKKGVPFE